MSFFYRKLIKIDELKNLLENKGLALEEKEELLILTKDILHHRVIETVLTHLPEEHHQEFLTTFAEKPHDKGILGFLKEKVEDIEEKIVQVIEKVKAEILADLCSDPL